LTNKNERVIKKRWLLCPKAEAIMEDGKKTNRDRDGYDLINFRKKIYSQYGEEGIIEKILKDLSIGKGTFLEFGAGDGVTLSNTRFLADAGWGGLCIEADENKFLKLEDSYKNYPLIQTMHCPVSVRGENSIDNLLRKTELPIDIDFASIDIDGNDYQIWDSMVFYKPKIILTETNFTFPFNLEFVQKEDLHIGSSAVAMYYLGLKKGYTFVCYNFINCFFVRNDLVPRLKLKNGSFAYLYFIGIQAGLTGFFISDYDGNWHATLPNINIWGTGNTIQLFHTNQKLREEAYLFRYIQDSNEIATLFEDKVNLF
jgi:hypothetical protein